MKAVLVEDEKHSRETLRNLIEEFCKDVYIVGVAESVDDAVQVIRSTNPDLVFLDIELQTGSGFDVLSKLSDMSFDVIFTTAYEHYAIRAIKFSSLDYLLKPIDIEELQRAVNKARANHYVAYQKQQLETLLANIAGKTVKRICLATADRLEFVSVSDISLCEASGSYTNFYMKDGRKVMVSKHLKEYETLLTDEQFMRVHNSFLVNLKEVKQYVKSEGGYLIMNDNKQVSISPKKRDEFLSRIGM
ncbi:LytTR family DNA-binding domain-containing protein [Cytophagales bacterium LB-30]|uniref:LytTR family DNA-binding domain-containing protein n=1 Tax=Shiella aurantiaca TaxID=3058365 RepID=A0ABT8F719_9BACT|nr:LytTR family DNA-binding domain-containing protein [Shiella aurantiaca]MDN4166267.1 LytTR family DNA-binding domain-containing protein [Shiella aurantiaca]